MFRVLGMLVLMVTGALIGGLIGMIAGTAVIEFGARACADTSCAAAIIKTWAPLGAVLGALAGFAKAFALRAGA